MAVQITEKLSQLNDQLIIVTNPDSTINVPTLIASPGRINPTLSVQAVPDNNISLNGYLKAPTENTTENHIDERVNLQRRSIVIEAISHDLSNAITFMFTLVNLVLNDEVKALSKIIHPQIDISTLGEIERIGNTNELETEAMNKLMGLDLDGSINTRNLIMCLFQLKEILADFLKATKQENLDLEKSKEAYDIFIKRILEHFDVLQQHLDHSTSSIAQYFPESKQTLISRYETNRKHFEGKVTLPLCSIPYLVQSITSNYQFSGDKNQKLEIKGELDFSIGNVDINMLLIMLNNLIDNALKYGEANSTISITILPINLFAEDGGEWKFIIKNSGTIIDKSERESVFDGKRAFNSKGIHGNGLGLPMVKRYIGQLGGSITMKSTSKPHPDNLRYGETEFTLTFPMNFPEIPNDVLAIVIES